VGKNKADGKIIKFLVAYVQVKSSGVSQWRWPPCAGEVPPFAERQGALSYVLSLGKKRKNRKETNN
jgi:hypothetical protein